MTTAVAATATSAQRTILLFMIPSAPQAGSAAGGPRGGRGKSVEHRVQDTVTEAGNPTASVCFHLSPLPA